MSRETLKIVLVLAVLSLMMLALTRDSVDGTVFMIAIGLLLVLVCGFSNPSV